jgi:serine/threonine protein kinase
MNQRYVILGKIGQGHLGSVYRAFDKNLNREVAVKKLSSIKKSSSNDEATRFLTEEAGRLCGLQNPHIVSIYDVGMNDETPFVVMELISGKSIDQIVKTTSFAWADFRELVLQTQDALVAAHDINLIHGDLKPSNIILSFSPSGKLQVKVVDFGLAKFNNKQNILIENNETSFKAAHFMCPEQLEQQPIDRRSDLYSMGCVYYYALTGLLPFNGETISHVMVSHLDHRILPLHEIRPDLPRWASDWVMWHINRFPTQRPSSALEALHFFQQSEEESQMELTAPKTSSLSRQAARVTRKISAPTKPKTIKKQTQVNSSPTNKKEVRRVVMETQITQSAAEPSAEVIYNSPFSIN